MSRKLLVGMLGFVVAVYVYERTSETEIYADPASRSALQMKATLLTQGEYRREFANLALEDVSSYFEVHCIVTNVSKTPQTIQAFSCSWDQNWQTDNQQIFCPGWECYANALQFIKIAPGKRYEKTVPLRVQPGAKGKTIRFRVGFSAVPPSGRKSAPPVTWSAPLTLSVPK